MPYSEKQQHLLNAIRHGFHPTTAMKNVTPAKAAEMLSHRKRKTAANALAGRH